MDLRNRLHLFVGRSRWLKKPLPPHLLDTVYVPLPRGRRIYADARDMRGPSFHVMFGGALGFERYELQEKEEVLRHLPEEGVFIDVGANIGLFSFFAHWARPRAEIHAFEPHPRNIECLRRSCEANRITRVHPHAFAIGDEEGELELYFNETDAGGHSAYRELLGSLRGPAQSARVPVTTLDKFVAREALGRVDVIKIDTQGGEAAALRGARETLKRFKPALLIEIDYRHLLESSAAGSPLDALAASGVPYHARPIGGRSEALSLEELKASAGQELGRGVLQRNYLFTATGATATL